jgi:hypothetical protein
MTSTWIRHHIQGAVEVVMQMLDSYDYGQDAGLAHSSLVPFADAVVTIYDQHWGPRRKWEAQARPGSITRDLPS